MRTISLPTSSTPQKSMLWQVGIKGGVQRIGERFSIGSGQGEGGTLIVCGLKLLNVGNTFQNGYDLPRPESMWMLRQLIQYAYTAPKSSVKLNFSVKHCPDCFPTLQVVLHAANSSSSLNQRTPELWV